MISLLINMTLFFLVPCTALADCILTDTPYKFEIVCSGYNPSKPTTDVLNKKTGKRPHKARNVFIEEKTSETPPIIMTEEELQIMQTKNRQDGLRDGHNLSGISVKR